MPKFKRNNPNGYQIILTPDNIATSSGLTIDENAVTKSKLRSFQAFIGIDPGQSGALAMIDDDNHILELVDWPGDEIRLAQIMNEIKTKYSNFIITGAIEYVHSMPKQGVVSAFKFGTNYGIWRGMLALLKIPFHTVRPQTWQKGLIKKAQDKKPAVAAAGRLFPSAPLHGPRGGGKDGRADALLIAYWCKKVSRTQIK